MVQEVRPNGRKWVIGYVPSKRLLKHLTFSLIVSWLTHDLCPLLHAFAMIGSAIPGPPHVQVTVAICYLEPKQTFPPSNLISSGHGGRKLTNKQIELEE